MKTKTRKPASAVIPAKWERHHRKLRALRELLLAGRANAETGVSDSLEPGGLDDLDRASDETDHDLALGLLGHEENGLMEVNEALRRIEEGRYGICEETGKPIPEARLNVVPWTRYTREAMERIEKRRQGGRPRQADVVSLRGSAALGLAEAPEPEDANNPHQPWET